MFHRAPRTGTQDSVNRIGPKDTSQKMVQSYNDGRWDQHLPIAIKEEKGERAEDMKVSFDATAGEMNQETGEKHLRDRDGVSRDGGTGSQEGQRNGESGNCGAEENGRPD